MLMNIIGKNCSNQLGNSGQQQIGVKCFGILSFTVGKTETVFDLGQVNLNRIRPFFLLTRPSDFMGREGSFGQQGIPSALTGQSG